MIDAFKLPFEAVATLPIWQQVFTYGTLVLISLWIIAQRGVRA